MTNLDPNRSNWRTLLAVVFVALIVRALLCSQLACISRDGVHFVSYAKQLGDDPVRWLRATTKQPGYAYLLLGTHKVLGPAPAEDGPLAWQRCGQLVALLGGVAACALIYLLTRRLFDSTTAAVAGIFAAFWWQGARLSADVLSDMPHLALYLAALLLGLSALKSRQLWKPALCGLAAGLAYLLRQEALGIVAAVVICLLWPSRGLSPRRRVLSVAVLALCFAAVVAPYAVAVGKFMPNKGASDLFHAASPVSLVLDRPPVMLAHVIQWWQAPARMAEAWARSGRYTISTLVLFALFLKSTPRAESTGRRLVITAVLLQVVLVQLRVARYDEISTRYMVIPLALSIPWAAAGLVTLLNLIIRMLEPSGTVTRAVVVMVGIAVPLAPQVFYNAKSINEDRRALRDAGRWLYDHVEPGDRVLAHERLTQLMFYAGRTYPDETWIRMPESPPRKSPPHESGDPASNVIRQVREHITQDENRPTWFVDVEATRRSKIAESAYFQALLDSAIPQLHHKWYTGPEGRQAHIFRVAPIPSRPLPPDP